MKEEENAHDSTIARTSATLVPRALQRMVVVPPCVLPYSSCSSLSYNNLQHENYTNHNLNRTLLYRN